MITVDVCSHERGDLIEISDNEDYGNVLILNRQDAIEILEKLPAAIAQMAVSIKEEVRP